VRERMRYPASTGDEVLTARAESMMPQCPAWMDAATGLHADGEIEGLCLPGIQKQQSHLV